MQDEYLENADSAISEEIGSNNNSVNQLVGKREAKAAKGKAMNFLLKHCLLINLSSYLEAPPQSGEPALSIRPVLR